MFLAMDFPKSLLGMGCIQAGNAATLGIPILPTTRLYSLDFLAFKIGPVLICRSPCNTPGDIQKAWAVAGQEGEPFVNLQHVLVFSSKGKRPLADMLAGGDLDVSIDHGPSLCRCQLRLLKYAPYCYLFKGRLILCDCKWSVRRDVMSAVVVNQRRCDGRQKKTAYYDF
jgi:hypothetical protein